MTTEGKLLQRCGMCGYEGTDTDHIGQCPRCRWDELRPLVAAPQAEQRQQFEAFHTRRKSKGAAYREGLFALREDGTYADDSVQRHWWTWQNALTAIRPELEQLRAAVADNVLAQTMLTDLTITNGGLLLSAQGGAASLLAEMLATQYRDGKGVNYIEVAFTSKQAVPGVSFVVTVQRVEGQTPHQLRAAAEAERDALRAFAQGVMRSWPHGDVDGGDLQGLAHKHGLIKPETRSEPCGEVCYCAEMVSSDEWASGVECFRHTPLLTGKASA